MNDKLPDFLQDVIEEYPEVWKAYQALGEACGTAGPARTQNRETCQTCIGYRGKV